MFLTNKKRLNGIYKICYSRVYIERFDYLPLFYFGPKFLSIKRFRHILWKWMENGQIYRVSKKSLLTNIYFWPFLRDPAAKLMPHSWISFKNLFYKADLEFYFFFQNKCYSRVKEKCVFKAFFIFFLSSCHSFFLE